ncbi:MAG TPA: hypothetical protein VKV37_09085 [Ktedonobacteraceae bacterium]|nr:hypothetical protein [Ktedonobacteraceae bacterium]
MGNRQGEGTGKTGDRQGEGTGKTGDRQGEDGRKGRLYISSVPANG